MGELLNKYRFGLFGLVIFAMLLATSFVIVREDQQVVITRMGKADRVVNRFRPDNADGAGIVVKLPLIEQAVWLPRGLLSVSHPSQKVRSTDQQWLMVDVDVTYRIINPVKMVGTLGTTEKADAQIKTMLPPLLEQALSQHSSGTIARPGAGGAAAQLTKALDSKTRQYGIQVIDVRVARVALEQASLTEVYTRMRDRQEAAVYEIRKKSAADAAAIINLANADAADLLQKSAGRDPAFYQFFKAMRFCEERFGQPPAKDADKKGKPSIVLPPECTLPK